jgi:hypothetical protein
LAYLTKFAVCKTLNDNHDCGDLSMNNTIYRAAFLAALLSTAISAQASDPTASKPGVPPAKPTVATPLPGTAPVGRTTAEVVVIPMKGHFGFEADSREWIDPDAFAAMAKQAKTLNPKFVVLDIESGGGMVLVMNEIAETIMNEFPAGGGTAVVAWPGVAGSAASFVTLTCPTIVVKPTARVGAALTIVPTPKGWVAVDDIPGDKSGYAQKMKSFGDAFDRLAMQYGGHPPEIRAAMATQGASLYWSPSQKKFFAAPPDPKNRGDLKELDNGTSVLTMTAPEMVDYGLAVQARDEKELRSVLGLKADASLVRLGSELPAWFQAIRRAIEPAIKDVDQAPVHLKTYIDGLRAWLKFDAQVKTNDAKRRANVGDKDRDRDAYDAAGKRLRAARDQAGRAAGGAATALRDIAKRIDTARSALNRLGMTPFMLPSTAALVPQIQASLACHDKGDYAGAINAVTAK